MKAIVKETGKIRKVTGVWLEDGSMIKPDKIQLIVGEGSEKESNFIDWEQRRWELVKAAMQGLISSETYSEESESAIAEMAICQAEAVLAKYSKGGEK